MKPTFQFPQLYAALRESADNRHRVVADLREGVETGAYRLGENGLEIGRLFEGMFGYNAQDFLSNEGAVSRAIQESATGVTMNDFKIVTQGMLMREIRDSLATADLIGDRLMRVEQSMPRNNSQNVPWVGGSTRWDESITAELEPFAPIAPRNGYMQYPKQNKHGKVIPISKESLLADRSSVIIRSCRNAVNGGLITRNILQLKTVLGLRNNWSFGLTDGATTAYGVYNAAASGPSPANSIATLPLASWESIDTALQTYRNMRDPVSGEFAAMPSKLQMIVPMFLLSKASVIRNAINYSAYNAAAASATIRYEGPNPLTYVYPGMEIEVIASPYIDEITGSTPATYTWYIGNFPEAFLNDQVYGPTPDELGSGSESSFWRDMNLALKMSFHEEYFPYNPTQVIKIANT